MAQDKDPSSWNLTQARLTAFPLVPLEYSLFNWWVELFGEKPATRTELPREGRLSEEGSFASEKLRLTIQPHRVDWFFQPSDEKVSESPAPADIGSWPKAIDGFSGFAKSWIKTKSLPEFRRLAFGAILSEPVKDGKDGYKKLSKYLPTVKIDPENSTDFFYQINRPRDQSTVLPEVSINRLCKWSVSQEQMGIIRPGELTLVPTSSFFACRLETDINTSPDFRYKLEKLELLYDEFVNLAIEISEKGDIK